MYDNIKDSKCVDVCHIRQNLVVIV